MEEEIKLNEELLKEYENLENEEQGIQTTFNEDSIEDLNDSSIDAQIENTNEEEIEGIGAEGFSMRTVYRFTSMVVMPGTIISRTCRSTS